MSKRQPAVVEEKTGVQTLEDAIRAAYGGFTRAERSIATYVLDHLHLISFETNGSIATKVGVSEMTVIRFVRALGYANLKDLKEDLRIQMTSDGWDLDDAMDRFHVRREGIEHLRESLDLEIRAILKVYELASSDRWHDVVALLAGIETIHIVGFQASKGLAMDFANRLKYARDGVHFAEGGTGTYSEVLEADPKTSCLVIVDTAAYARKAVLLAKRAKARGQPLVIVTDKFKHWASDHTDFVLEAHTHVRTFWDSTASLSALLNLMIDAIASRLGDKAQERFLDLVDLGDYFEEFEPLSERRRKKPGKSPSNGRTNPSRG